MANQFLNSICFLSIVIMFGQISGTSAANSVEGIEKANDDNSMATAIRTGMRTGMTEAINLSCLDLVNYWSQLFNENLLKPQTLRLFSPIFGDLSQIYFVLVSVLNFFQITLNDLRSHTSGIECMAEQFAFCRAIDESVVSLMPKNNYMNHMFNHANFYLQSNHNFNPLFAIWNSGYLSYKCLCKTC